MEETVNADKNKGAEHSQNTVQVVALGDSLTRGTGDVSGKGYVGLVTSQLKEDLSPQEIIVSNLGINGQTSSQLLQQLDQQNIGRQVAESDIILMTIGGNDLFQQGETLFNMNLANIEQLKTQYLANLEQIFQKYADIIQGRPYLSLDCTTHLSNWMIMM